MDYLIIGAGPAGLQLGYFLHRARRNYVILEAGTTPGNFFRDFPRHRKMISINKPHTGWEDPELNLRMDWNSLLSDDPDLLFTRYTERYFPHADDYLRYLGDFAAGHGLNVKLRTRAVQVAREGGEFVVTATGTRDGAVFLQRRQATSFDDVIDLFSPITGAGLGHGQLHRLFTRTTPSRPGRASSYQRAPLTQKMRSAGAVI